GQSEEQLSDVVARLRNSSTFPLRAGAPQVIYRETLTRSVTIDYTHKRQRGGTGEFARVKIQFEPQNSGDDLVFLDRQANQEIPTDFIPAIANGIWEQSRHGLVAGFPVINFRATLVGGACHEVDSNDQSFERASRAAFLEIAAADTQAVALIEPIMKLTVT